MASISTLTREGKVIGFQVNLGVGSDGKKERKFFRRFEDAMAYRDSATKDPLGAKVLFDNEAEIRFCLQRVAAVDATLGEAVEFFLKHGARRGNPAFVSLVSDFIRDKEKVGRTSNYLGGLKDRFDTFAAHIGADAKVGDVTSEQVDNYVYAVRKDLGAVTKSDYLRSLSILFNYAIKRQYISINPVKAVERPKKVFHAPKVLAPEDCAILLNRCLRKKWHDRLAVFVLTAFCGIRTEEACKLRWDNIDLENKKVLVPADIAKKARFRRNIIPPNALKWLRTIHDARRTGPIIGANAKRLLNVATRFAHIDYSQNCLRHSFCSYALEAGWPLADVVAYLGHAQSPAILHAHYRNIVEPKAAKKWWAIVPSQSAA